MKIQETTEVLSEDGDYSTVLTGKSFNINCNEPKTQEEFNDLVTVINSYFGTNWSGAVIGTNCYLDDGPHIWPGYEV